MTAKLEEVLKVVNLHKSFKELKAVCGISFEVMKGQCFGLLGPNGAGKSTSIEIIEGVINQDQGEILYHGQPFVGKLRELMGVQFQNTELPLRLTVYETLATFRSFYKNGLGLEELIELCQLSEFKDQLHSKISGGQKQRLFLALALCNNPELILLDEPTTGLDPQARRHLWDIINNIKSQGKTIILTTHYMDEAQQLCDDIGIMDHGQIIARGSPQQLLYEHCKNTIVYLPTGEAASNVINNPQDFCDVRKTITGIEFKTQNLNYVLQKLASFGSDLSGINIRQSNLEDLFIQLTGKGLRN